MEQVVALEQAGSKAVVGFVVQEIGQQVFGYLHLTHKQFETLGIWIKTKFSIF